ncbi:hypothetical protein [Chryseobacterium gregarium]|uniref:hypothetical protein n=1 Tax=Chryseobacterium gregarium TaxID=456299 RepID=UPI000406507A|nr:hypothetical protein [Chryseobacterium gregarium]
MIYALIFTILIISKLYQKKRKKNIQTSVSSLIFPGLMIGFVSFFFFMLGEIIVSSAYSSAFDKRYEAKVISYQPLTETQIPVVEFKGDQNKIIQLPLDYGSNDPMAIGTVIQVSYKEGNDEVKNLSFGEDKLLTGIVLVFFFIFSLAVLGIALYAFDRDISFIWKIIGGIFAYIVIPGAMLGFIIVFSWSIWEYFQGRKDDMPIWALGICSLFTTLLIPSLLGYFKLMFSKNDIIKTRKASNSKIKTRISKFSKRIPK